MILIVCVDERMGMAFGGRRLSRDRAVYEDIASACGKIWLSPRSAALFEGVDIELVADENFLDNAPKGECCFAEFLSPAPYEHRIEKIILYRWNRRYPSDTKLGIELEAWQPESVTDFPGSSHEKITKEVYVRE